MTFPKCVNRAAVIALLIGCAASGRTIKLGSLAPTGSPWDDGLRRIATRWEELSNGEVKLKIYGGGILGGEMDMIRKMRIGQLDAAGMTGVGLCRIHPVILNIQAPLTVRTDEELAFVLDNVKPRYEKGLEKQGFKVIAWNMVGWVHFFSKEPVVKPADLRKQKLFVWAGDADGAQAWKELGFHPVPLAVTDLMSSLQSGMVEAFSATPLSAASQQWFALAPNMCAMRWAPLVGAIVVNTRVWNKISPELRPRLLEASRKAAAEMQEETGKADAEAVEIMKKHNLTVNPVPADAVAEWKGVVESGLPKLYGNSLDKEEIESIRALLRDFRTSSQSR